MSMEQLAAFSLVQLLIARHQITPNKMLLNVAGYFGWGFLPVGFRSNRFWPANQAFVYIITWLPSCFISSSGYIFYNSIFSLYRLHYYGKVIIAC